MLVSLRWLVRLLDRPIDADEAERVLTFAGFPVESRREAGQDVLLDVEVTSNRGDCLCHAGLAREIAASSGRRLVTARAAPSQGSGPAPIALENRVPRECPLFTATVIRGVSAGPSPPWLGQALESVGQRAINAVVDVTNYINLELGNPCHVFDMSRLAGRRLIVRWGIPGERLRTLDGREWTLRTPARRAHGRLAPLRATRRARDHPRRGRQGRRTDPLVLRGSGRG
jgi:phenylalanyl-tRNA synthetase beta chain